MAATPEQVRGPVRGFGPAPHWLARPFVACKTIAPMIASVTAAPRKSLAMLVGGRRRADGAWPGPQGSLRSLAARAGQRRGVPGPVLARGRPAVAGPVASARVLDPQIAVDPGRPRVEPRRRPQRPAGWVAPARIVAAGVRPAAVTAGVDDGPGRAD